MRTASSEVLMLCAFVLGGFMACASIRRFLVCSAWKIVTTKTTARLQDAEQANECIQLQFIRHSNSCGTQTCVGGSEGCAMARWLNASGKTNRQMILNRLKLKSRYYALNAIECIDKMGMDLALAFSENRQTIMNNVLQARHQTNAINGDK